VSPHLTVLVRTRVCLWNVCPRLSVGRTAPREVWCSVCAHVLPRAIGVVKQLLGVIEAKHCTLAVRLSSGSISVPLTLHFYKASRYESEALRLW
jgi:hypothetical protein